MKSQPEPDQKTWRRPRKLRGLGDVVAMVAEPIAAMSDALLGTKLKGCRGCGERRDEWNEKYPLPLRKGSGE